MGLLLASLAVAPAAEAQRAVCPPPLSVPGLVQCAHDHVSTTLDLAGYVAACALMYPPWTNPTHAIGCFTLVPALP